jgi:hypothetical protein
MARVQLQPHTVCLPPVEIVWPTTAQIDERVDDVMDGFLLLIALAFFSYVFQLAHPKFLPLFATVVDAGLAQNLVNESPQHL